MSNRLSLSTLILIALLSWAGLLWFTYRVPPLASPAFIALFLILAVALTSTGAPIAYLIGKLLSPTQSTVRSAIRRGALFALIVVLNLMLRALGSWNVFTAVLIVLAVVVVEVIALAHR
jgi:hypothetical protein